MKRLTTAAILLLVISQFQNCSDVSFATNEAPTTNTSNEQSVANSNIENFVFNKISNKIDILVVVDNSVSMTKEQESLAAGFNNFIGNLTQIDWQIGVTTTDINDKGRFVGPANLSKSNVYGTQYIIKSDSPNAEELFANTVQRTNSHGFVNGSGDEQGIHSANLTVLGHNDGEVAKGFFRDNSNLAIVILSDEDERSCGNDSTRLDCQDDNDNYKEFQPLNYPASLVETVKQTFTNTKKLLVNAIVIKANDTSCFELQNNGRTGLGPAGKYGLVYSQLVELTQGVLGSICDNADSGFTEDLQNISQSIKEQVNPESITLQNIPLLAPQVILSVADVTQPATTGLVYEWQAGTSVIRFNKYPANTKIQV